MLKHLIRGWWTRGVCGGGREEGCREEGGLRGCTASREHVIYEGLGRGVKTRRRDDSSEGEAAGLTWQSQGPGKGCHEVGLWA